MLETMTQQLYTFLFLMALMGSSLAWNVKNFYEAADHLMANSWNDYHSRDFIAAMNSVLYKNSALQSASQIENLFNVNQEKCYSDLMLLLREIEKSAPWALQSKLTVYCATKMEYEYDVQNFDVCKTRVTVLLLNLVAYFSYFSE